MFKRLFSFPKCQKKRFKVFAAEFEQKVASPVAKVWYDILSITGKDINVRRVAKGSMFNETVTDGVLHKMKMSRRLHQLGLA